MECNFPQEIDNFERFLEPDIEALKAINQYYSFYDKGDLSSARKVLDDNPLLKRMIINADNLNRLRDMVIALERYYMDDIEKYLQNIIDYRGVYSSTAKYDKYNVVYYVRNDARETFMAVSNNIPMGTLPTNITYFIPLTLRGAQGASGTGLAPRGIWSDVVSYQKDDCVSWHGILWQCMADNTGYEPVESDPSYWIAILHIPQQVITSENMPEGQNSNDIWIQEYPDTLLVDIKRKKPDGLYEDKYPKTIFKDGTPVENHNKDTNLHMVDAECIYSADTSVYQIDPNGSFTAEELGNAVSIRFKAPNNYVSNASFSLFGEEYAPSNMGFISDSIVVVHFDCTQKKCYAGSGGSGRKSSTLVVGTVLSGHSSVDVDYLCDGTNDEEEINTALSSLPSGGGKVVILEGTYNISSPIRVLSNTTLEGMGESTVLKRCWASSSLSGVISIINQSLSRIESLCIDGAGLKNSYNNAEYAFNCGIYCSNSDVVQSWNLTHVQSANLIRGVSVYNSEIGIYINGVRDTVTHCKVDKNDVSSRGYGICVSGVSCIIEANTVSNTIHESGIEINGEQHIISGNVCFNGKYGIRVNLNGSDISITSNTAANNTLSGIDINTTKKNVNVSGNICRSNGQNGISILGCCICIISNNICSDNGTLGENQTSRGIDVNSAMGCTINSNIIDRHNNGIRLSGNSKGNTVVGNTVQNSDTSGIHPDFNPLQLFQYTILVESQCTNNLISNNVLTGRNCEDQGVNNTVINNQYQERLSYT